MKNTIGMLLSATFGILACTPAKATIPTPKPPTFAGRTWHQMKNTEHPIALPALFGCFAVFSAVGGFYAARYVHSVGEQPESKTQPRPSRNEVPTFSNNKQTQKINQEEKAIDDIINLVTAADEKNKRDPFGMETNSTDSFGLEIRYIDPTTKQQPPKKGSRTTHPGSQKQDNQKLSMGAPRRTKNKAAYTASHHSLHNEIADPEQIIHMSPPSFDKMCHTLTTLCRQNIQRITITHQERRISHTVKTKELLKKINEHLEKHLKNRK